MTGNRYRAGHHVSPRGVRIMAAALEAEMRRIDGLEDIKLPDGIAQACVEDGRPYIEFVEELLRLGLEQWKTEVRPRVLFNP